MPVERSLTLRPATAADAELLREWRNEPEVVAQTLSGATVGEAEHADWLARTLADSTARLYVVEDGGEPIGQLRLTAAGAGEAEVHISLVAEARGRGIGRQALGHATELAASELGAASLIARVLASNERSLRAFRAAGFEERERGGGAVVLVRPTSG